MKKFILLIVTIFGIYFGYKYFQNIDVKEENKFVYQDLLDKIGENKAIVDTFTIYGKYLNIKGVLPSNDKEFSIVFKNNNEEINIPLIVDNTRFSTNNYINDGIDLEKLKIGNYLMLLRKNSEPEPIYYHLTNTTDYHDNKYYTMTKNKKNNLITFKESKHDNYNYWELVVKEEKLPSDVYDIVIDPGHGGNDSGATNGKYRESAFTLDYAKTLKNTLEEEGLKVKLTREEDKKIDNYGVGSRTGIPYEAKAKLMLSVHLNSSGYKSQNGVEVYYAYQDNNSYAKSIADNIVKYANTVYSNNPENKISDGIYMRVYSKANINALAQEAKREGYEPYDLSNHETYYFFIRETGGIMTHAFSDGRNPKYKENVYRNYNQGVEAYLLELGYISNTEDLKNIINNKSGYIKAIKESILSYASLNETVKETSN